MSEQDKQADAVKVKYTTDDFIGHVKVTISEKEVRVWVCDEKGCQFRFKAMGKVEKSGGDVMVVAENKSYDALVKACYEARSIIQTDQRYPGFARSCNCRHCTMCKLNAAIAKAEKGA